MLTKEEMTSNKTLGYSLILAAGFALLVVYVFLQKGGFLYFFLVAPFAYIAAFGVLLMFVEESRRRLVLVSSIILGSLAIVAVTSVVTISHGYPVSYQGTVTSCTDVRIPNATSPWGYTYGSQCSTSPTVTATAFAWNFLYWLPVSGLVLFTIPTWRKDKSVSERAGYAVIGLVLLVALLLPLVGIPSVGS